MAKFIMRQMAEGMAGGKCAGKRYPHLLRLMEKDLDDVAQMAAKNTTFSVQELKSAVSVLAEAVATLAAEGYTVKLDGLGSFRPRLKLKDTAPEEHEGDTSQRTGASVKVAGFTFRPDKELVFQTNIQAHLERVSVRRWRKSGPLPEEERRERLRAFLEENTVATVPDYCRLSGLLHTAAAKELREMAREENAFIERRGARTSLVYVLKKGGG